MRILVSAKNCAALLLCMIVCTPGFPAPSSDRYRIVGYVAGWATPAVIPSGLSHINFAFARIGPDGRVALADTGLETSLLRLVALKKTNPHLKIIISIGGWQADGSSDPALTPAPRAVFAAIAVLRARTHAVLA